MKTPKKQLLSAVILTTGLLSSTALLADDAQTAEHVGEMVNLAVAANNEICPLSGYAWYHFSINADATLSEFSIPTGFTLVITGVEYGGVFIESDTGYQLIYSSMSGATGIQDVVVKPGVKICGNTGANIHGHFEKNR